MIGFFPFVILGAAEIFLDSFLEVIKIAPLKKATFQRNLMFYRLKMGPFGCSGNVFLKIFGRPDSI